MKTHLEEILSAIGDQDGAQLLGSDGMAIKIKGVISTGVYGIDRAIGRGGIPTGRLTLLWGGEGSGKTTLALHVVSSCQKMGGVAVYIDVEYKLDPEYAKNIGVNIDNLIIVQPPTLERIFEIIEKVIKKVNVLRKSSKEEIPVVVVLDSMNAAITKSELNGEWDDVHVSPQARVYSRLLPKLIPLVSKESIALLFISQERTKINVQYGQNITICGGKAPGFYASLIMKVISIGNEKTDGERVANKVRVECVKNQIAPPFRKSDNIITYGEGFSNERSILECSLKRGIIKRSGPYFKFDGNSIGQGGKAAAEALKTDKVLLKRVMKKLRKVDNG